MRIFRDIFENIAGIGIGALRKFAAVVIVSGVLFPAVLSAQTTDGSDSLVVLISSKSAQVVDVEGSAYRKVIGPARFFSQQHLPFV